ncbi:hypothetical protein Efla_001901 [Eimeria flavescens]
MEGKGGSQLRNKQQAVLPQSSIARGSRGTGRRRVPRSVYQAVHYDSFELPTSLQSPTFSADIPALAASLKEGGLILFDLTAHDAAVAAAPEEIVEVALSSPGGSRLLWTHKLLWGRHTLWGVQGKLALPPLLFIVAARFARDGFLRRWIIRGFNDLVEIEQIAFNEEAIALFLSHSGRSVVAVGRGGLMLIASSLYADCAHYTRLQWPSAPSGGLSTPSGLSIYHPNSSHSSSCSNGDTGRDGTLHRTGFVGEAAGPPPRAVTQVEAEVADCALLPDVLLHPRASDSADVFYIAVASPSHGLMICNVILSEPEYTHQFAASILLTRHLPGCFWKLAAARAPMPEFILQQQQQQNQQQMRADGLLSLDSICSIELRADGLPSLDKESAAEKSPTSINEIVLLACLSPQSRFLTFIALIPNTQDYPGCDLHASVVELAPVGGPHVDGWNPVHGPQWNSVGLTAVDWMGADEDSGGYPFALDDMDEDTDVDEEAQLNRQQGYCKSYRPLLCVGAPDSSVFVYEVTYYFPPGAHDASRRSRTLTAIVRPGAAEGQNQQALQLRLRLVYKLDGNRGHSKLLKVPPSIVGGRRVLACSSGPHLLNLFEFSRTPNPDLYAVRDEIAGSGSGLLNRKERDELTQESYTSRHQAASEAQQHAAASAAYIDYLRKSFSGGGAANAASQMYADAANGPVPTKDVSTNVHHNKGLEMQHLLLPSLRGAAAVAAVRGEPPQDKALKNQIDQITADLQACTLGNQQLQRMQQQQQQAAGSDPRPPWNDRFYVKGSKLDKLLG